MVPLKILWNYFPERRGLVTGICVSGYGIGSLFLGILSNYYINPNNETDIINN
jgi:hypothetical protein